MQTDRERFFTCCTHRPQKHAPISVLYIDPRNHRGQQFVSICRTPTASLYTQTVSKLTTASPVMDRRRMAGRRKSFLASLASCFYGASHRHFEVGSSAPLLVLDLRAPWMGKTCYCSFCVTVAEDTRTPPSLACAMRDTAGNDHFNTRWTWIIVLLQSREDILNQNKKSLLVSVRINSSSG